MLVFAVVSAETEKAVELFVRREDAERFLAEVRADDAELSEALRLDPPAQAEALRSRDDVRHDREAIWAATEEGQAALRRDREEARERYRREWGRSPDS